ncbi:MAG: class I adenylate-forming enzyme family protein [Hyphomicrobiales bacterium]|nr:class I adenylate-forming enzyme family protein [Hyphomicrobiales bacterium]
MSTPGAVGRLGLSGLLRHWAELKPEALALADQPNKERLGLGAPRRLTFAQTDAAVDRLAAFLLASGVGPGAIAALQMPHTTESLLIALACLRAGVCAAITPFAWRRHEVSAAFASLAVEAAIGSWAGGRSQSHVLTAAGVRNAELCFAFTFGEEAPDGLTNLDDLIDLGDKPPSVSHEEPQSAAFLHFAPRARAMPLIIPRSNRDLVAAGLASSTSASLNDRTVLLSAFPISGVTGLAGFFAPWLITGASLILHHPFDNALFGCQLSGEGVTFTALPAEVADGVEREISLTALNPPVIARVYSLPPAKTTQPDTVEAARGAVGLLNIAEYALLARPAAAMPAAWLPLGVASHATGNAALTFLETRLRGKILRKETTSMLSGELCLRGAAAPTLLGTLAELNPGASIVDADDFINTGLECTFADAAMSMIACAPQPLLARMGGVAIDIEELDRLYAGFPGFLDAAAFTISDRLLGERIFAAVAPPPGESVAESDFRNYLESLDIAPFKFPEKLVVVKYVPRDSEGSVLRERILSEI